MTDSFEDKLKRLERRQPSEKLDQKVNQLFPAPFDPEFDGRHQANNAHGRGGRWKWMLWASAIALTGLLIGYALRPAVDERLGLSLVSPSPKPSQTTTVSTSSKVEDDQTPPIPTDNDIESVTRIDGDVFVRTKDGEMHRVIRMVTKKRMKVFDDQTKQFVEVDVDVPRYVITSADEI